MEKSREKEIKIIACIIIGIIIGLALYCLVKEFISLEQKEGEISEEEIEELIESTTAPSSLESQLSEEEIEDLIKGTTAPQ